MHQGASLRLPAEQDAFLGVLAQVFMHQGACLEHLRSLPA